MSKKYINLISQEILKDCLEKNNIFVVEEDIEEKIKKYPKLNKDHIKIIKNKINPYIIFTSYD